MNASASPFLKDEMRIDIYANAAKRSLVILMDRPFQSELKYLELNSDERRLYFIFEEGKRDLGDDINENIFSILCDHEIIDIIQIDIQTKEPVHGIKAPLSVIPPENVTDKPRVFE